MRTPGGRDGRFSARRDRQPRCFRGMPVERTERAAISRAGRFRARWRSSRTQGERRTRIRRCDRPGEPTGVQGCQRATTRRQAAQAPKKAIAGERGDRRAAGVTVCRRYGDTSLRPAGGQPARRADRSRRPVHLITQETLYREKQRVECVWLSGTQRPDGLYRGAHFDSVNVN